MKIRFDVSRKGVFIPFLEDTRALFIYTRMFPSDNICIELEQCNLSESEESGVLLDIANNHYTFSAWERMSIFQNTNTNEILWTFLREFDWNGANQFINNFKDNKVSIKGSEHSIELFSKLTGLDFKKISHDNFKEITSEQDEMTLNASPAQK